jgi:hypothetical protein
MASSSSIGTDSSEPSGLNDWLNEIKRLADEDRRKNGKPRYWIIGIDYGYNFEEEPGEIPVVIGYWYDR